MKISVQKDELQRKLQTIQSCVDKTASSRPILSHFLLNATKEGVTITGTDLTMILTEPLTATVSAAGSVAIPAVKCLEIVKEADEDIVLETDKEDGWLKIHYGKSKYRLACLPPKEFPAIPAAEFGCTMTFGNAEFLRILEGTIFAAADRTDAKYTLTGLLFELLLKEKQFAAVATDGHRLALKTKAIDIPDVPEGGQDKISIIVPRKAAAELKRILPKDGEMSLAIGKNLVLFSTGGVKFFVRLLEGTYPTWNQVIPTANNQILTIDRASFIKGIKKASIFCGSGNGVIVADMSPSLLVLSSLASQDGEAKDELPVEYVGAPLKIGINAEFLLDAVEALAGEKITVSFGTSISPILLRNAGEPTDHSCVVMPVRL